MKVKVGGTTIKLIKGDITTLATDAIVNAANSFLAHGGGVAGAISTLGGPSIQEESDLWVKANGGAIPVGSAAITTAGTLPCKYVIHAVGPRMGEGDEDEKLRQATISSLETARERGIRTIAFPAISTGIYGYPVDRCAKVMLTTTIDFVDEFDGIKEVIFCLFGEETFDLFKESLKKPIPNKKNLTYHGVRLCLKSGSNYRIITQP